MGPSSEDDGELDIQSRSEQSSEASMGPSSEDDGEAATGMQYLAQHGLLQWGRRPRTTERAYLTPIFANASQASMGPSSEDDGETNTGSTTVTITVASMGPSSEDDGESRGHISPGETWRASMGPSSEDDGEVFRPRCSGCLSTSFNGAVVRGRRRVPPRTARRSYSFRASMGPSSEDDGESERCK